MTMLHPTIRSRSRARAALSVVAGVGLLLGASGTVRSQPDAGAGQNRERIVIMTPGGAAGENEPMIRFGRNRDQEAAECIDGTAMRIDEHVGEELAPIVLCNRGDATPAERADRLQSARDRLANDSELSADARQRVISALNREIARLRGQ